MNRRRFVGVLGGAVLSGSAGCLGQGLGATDSDSPNPESETTIGATSMRNSSGGDEHSDSKATGTVVRKRTENITATFRVQSGEWSTPPPQETATADWQPTDEQIEVTGTIITDGCHNVVFESIQRVHDGASLEIGIGTERSDYAKSHDLDCGRGVSNYSIVLSVESTVPETIVVEHRHENGETKEFSIQQ